MGSYYERKKCRICSSHNLKLILDLGIQPPANSFIKKKDIIRERKFPLRLFFCKDCYLLQLCDIVNKEALFSNYLYLTGASKPIVGHFSKYAKNIFKNYLYKKNKPLVVEMGSNDGSLLREFKKNGVSILGIEPASNIARLANKLKIRTKNAFFSSELAKSISLKQKADVVIANNVVGHIDDLKDFVRGVKILLVDDGIFVFEVPYAIDLIKKLEFDTIYHEHLSYFTLHPLIKLFEQFNFEIFDVQKQKVHGGSIRVFVGKKGIHKIKPSVKKMILFELQKRIDKIKTYEKFSYGVANFKNTLFNKLNELKKKKRLFGYGAPAKGTVLLNYCNIDSKILDFIIDTTSLKQGLYTPGTHILILSPKIISKKGKNDIALMLAWNYSKDILKKEKKFRKRGGKFLIPIPKPRLV
jgi:SAM-dependent methyltransferase